MLDKIDSLYKKILIRRRRKKRTETALSRDGDRMNLMEFQVPKDWKPYWTREFGSNPNANKF